MSTQFTAMIPSRRRSDRWRQQRLVMFWQSAQLAITISLGVAIVILRVYMKDGRYSAVEQFHLPFVTMEHCYCSLASAAMFMLLKQLR